MIVLNTFSYHVHKTLNKISHLHIQYTIKNKQNFLPSIHNHQINNPILKESYIYNLHVSCFTINNRYSTTYQWKTQSNSSMKFLISHVINKNWFLSSTGKITTMWCANLFMIISFYQHMKIQAFGVYILGYPWLLYLPTVLDWTSASFQFPFSTLSLTRTMSPTCKFVQSTCHFCLISKVGK